MSRLLRPGMVLLLSMVSGCAGPRHAGGFGLEAERAAGCVSPPIEWVRIEAGPGVERPFLISRFEITNAQFKAFLDAAGYDGGEPHPGSRPERFLEHWRGGTVTPEDAARPVCHVNWHHATAFAAWLAEKSGARVRLPTDAEWYLAAAGREQRVYPWGDAWDPMRCNAAGDADGFPRSAPVGSFPSGATPEGVMDMAGNIWEWTVEKSLRGGPWCERPEWQRCDFVAREDEYRADDKFGLRVVMEIR